MLGQWKRVGILVVLSAVSSVELFAQAVDDTLRYAESLWSMEKKAMVLSRMNFTEAEKSSFWPVYESYTNATQYLDMEYIRLLRLESDQTLSSREAASIADRLLLNDLLLAKTRRQYFRRFRKAIAPDRAAEFMKVDQDFRTMLRVQMRSDSPGLLSSLDRVYFSN
jgi:hypothetical protein